MKEVTMKPMVKREDYNQQKAAIDEQYRLLRAFLILGAVLSTPRDLRMIVKPLVRRKNYTQIKNRIEREKMGVAVARNAKQVSSNVMAAALTQALERKYVTPKVKKLAQQ